MYRSLHEKLPVLVNRGNRMFRLPRFACYAIERMDQWMSAGMSFGKAMLPGTVEQKLIEKGVHFLNNFGFAFCSIRPAPNVPRAAIERLATYGQTDRPFPRQHSAQRGTSATIAAAAVSGFDTTMSGFPASYSEPTEADLAALLVDDDEHDDDDIFTCGRLEYQKRGGRKSHVFASAVFGCEHLKSTEDDACHLLPVLNPDWLSHAQKIDEEKALQELGRRDSCDL